jgi:DNA-binding winged helix-turn-helix (wHTH) protein
MLRFAGCRLDLDARRLFRGAREVHLSPKAFELLKVLVENRPRALSKAELLGRVWSGIFVSEASLARAVSEIRDGLGARRGRIVRTVHGYGYAFAGEIDAESPRRTVVESTAGHAANCWLTNASREVALHDGDQIAGRDPSTQIRLDSPKVSRRHARFVVDGTNVSVEDLGSKNGTFVCGKRVAAPMQLKPGDQIRIGPFAFVFRVELIPWSTETEVIAALQRRDRSEEPA